MIEKRIGINRRKILRKNAEALVESFAPEKSTAQAMDILVHELMVHKIELEMQNEELQRSNNAMEESRDHYVNFYEFAPVGYITLNRDGLINEINLTCCVLLGVERFRIMSRHLSNYVAPQDKDRWHRLFMNIMSHPEIEKQSFSLELKHADGSFLKTYFNCLKWNSFEDLQKLRISVTDISKLKNFT